MAAPNTSWRGSQEDSESSFVISDSEDDIDTTDEKLVSKKKHDSTNRESLSNDGRLSPMIRKAIRRSLHQFIEESSDDDEGRDKNEVKNTLIPDSDDPSDSDSSLQRVIRKTRHAIIDDSTEDDNSIENSRGASAVHEKSKIQQLDDESDAEESDNENQVIQLDSSDDEHISDSTNQRKPSSSLRVRDSLQVNVADMLSSTKISPSNNLVDSDGVVDLDSSENNENISDDSPTTSFAIGVAQEEMLNKTVDPIDAQKKAYLIFERHKIERELAKRKMLYHVGNLDVLPDKGERLKQSIEVAERELDEITKKLSKIKTGESDFGSLKPAEKKKSALSEISDYFPKSADVKKPLFKDGSLEIDPTYLRPTTGNRLTDLGKQAQATLQREQELTIDRLKDLHGSIVSRPADDEKAEDPRGLKVPLMPHQQHALAWLLWRETQNPRGGVLADDMGLGKTLTMISLVLASIALRKDGDTSDDEEEWLSNKRAQRFRGGTLVVAPASLVAQWESEIKNRCKKNLLSVELHHGNNRETNPKRLARNDVVITTYNIVSRQHRMGGILFKIRWRRVILDEAHVIRNHKSQMCESTCALDADKRWALTGTPIQNKELDLYSLLKFLRCSPFDDVRVWKRWVDNKNDAGLERLATVMKSIMLRRTKNELQAKGTLDALPDKTIQVVEVQLDKEERLVYDKVMIYSRTIFAQFLQQRAEKAHTFELQAGRFDKPSWQSTVKDTHFTKAQNKLLSTHADVQSHDILVLLLRLRQLCCHPSLIYSMLDNEDIERDGIENVTRHDDLLQRVNDRSMRTDDDELEGEVGVDEKVKDNLLTSDNPVFDKKRKSAKIRAILDKVEDITEMGDKVIIVSQWVSVLEIIARELDKVQGIKHEMFTGKVQVKDRQNIMDNFNDKRSRTNVLLLSLTAGGVGLNLVGANHLLLIDIHWNPQLECQAQDRIYRFGQKKNVFIYKYICMDTIEERIKNIQDHKLALASSVLSGGGKVIDSKLSLDEMKSLFGI